MLPTASADEGETTMARTWGRIPNPAYTLPSDIGDFVIGGSSIPPPPPYLWVEVDTDANGNDDLVMATAFLQVLKLNLNESPFFGDWGIPARQSVAQQVPPDYYVNLTQSRFAQYFASLIVDSVPAPPPHDIQYDVFITLKDGTVLSGPVPT
jgi:hypothetical protein